MTKKKYTKEWQKINTTHTKKERIIKQRKESDKQTNRQRDKYRQKDRSIIDIGRQIR